MAILFLSGWDHSSAWSDALTCELPDDEILIGPEDAARRADDIEFAIVWKPPPGLLATLTNLRAIFSLGAGVDHVFADPDLPNDVPLVRLIDPALTEQMTEWVVMNVLRHHRRMPLYATQQARSLWQRHEVPPARRRTVGMMGLGILGTAAAHALAPFGFPLTAWVHSPRHWDGGEIFAGRDGLGPFLARSEIVVCLLPLTTETRGILDARAFAQMPEGGAVINAARGGHVVAADLIDALDTGKLSGATLDVFETEPLPAADPLWRHPGITITPHAAALTLAATAAHEISLNIKRFRSGAPMNGVVQPDRSY